MTTSDVFLITGTVCLILITGFLCATLYYVTRVFRIWFAASKKMEDNLERCIDTFYNALHSLTSLKNVIEIGMQTVKAVGTLVETTRKGTRKSRTKNNLDE